MKGKTHNERRESIRIPITADVGEPIEITLAETASSAAAHNSKPKTKSVPAILTNISGGGMSIIVFGGQEFFTEKAKIQVIANLPGMAHAKIEGQIMHVRSHAEMQTLGVRFMTLAHDVRLRIQKIVGDYDDCETRISINIPEVCTGHACHYFGLCKKIQKSEPSSL